jgi:hypothetical protein
VSRAHGRGSFLAVATSPTSLAHKHARQPAIDCAARFLACTDPWIPAFYHSLLPHLYSINGLISSQRLDPLRCSLRSRPAHTPELTMANPAADPKAAPLADDLKEFALCVPADCTPPT